MQFYRIPEEKRFKLYDTLLISISPGIYPEGIGKDGLSLFMIKGILFDLDGTLTRPGALDFPAIKREMGCPEDQPILEYLESQSAEYKSRLLPILEEKEEIAAKKSRPNKGVEKLLSILKKRRILLGILTRNRLAAVERTIKNFNGVSIHDFTAIITRDDFPPKPNPHGVLKAASQMNLTPSELLVVGDFRFDIIAGKHAGAKTVLFTDGKREVMDEGDPKPDYTISRIEEILEILTSLKE
jgi:HAD superfamily hydrolase (TIGR01509 family)